MRIYVTRRLPDPVIQKLESCGAVRFWDSQLPPPREVLLREARDADGIFCFLQEKIDRELLDHAPRLKVVSDCSVGYDNIDVAACRARGVIATHTPDVLTDTVADTTFALILAAGRRILAADRFLREGRWTHWEFSLFAGADVHHATLGLLGMGRIARAVARRAAGFDMSVIACGRRRPDDPSLDRSVEWVSLDELLERSDYLSVHVPLNEETRKMIGRRELALMKPTAYLINTARGGVIDQAALFDALNEGTIAGAGLDVFEVEPLSADDPLTTLPNVVLLPHIGSASSRTRMAMADLAARNLCEALAGRQPPCPIPGV
ncbi:MAG TPA: D-glycerate dehydrogenase [Armatimonadota bacterium]|nr:D-glycerate dehydrogenase [Armatimonadota bacterium]